MNNDPTAAGEDCILASLERPSNYRLYYNSDRDTECIIDGSSKEEIRESLKQIYGITEDMLFPDFDGFAGQHSQDIPYAQRTASQYRASGDRLYRRQKYKDAIPEYDMAIRRDPDHAETYYQRGLVKFHLGQYEGAVTDFDMAIDRNSDYAEAYFQRGLANAENEKYREAITDYDKAIHRGFDTADVYYNRGNINARLQEYGAAAEDYDKAIHRGFDTADVYYNRGIMSALLEIYEAALEDYDKAIRRGLNTADIYYSQGGVLLQLGYAYEAEQVLQTALQLARQAGNEQLTVEIEQYIRDMNLDTGENQ